MAKRVTTLGDARSVLFRLPRGLHAALQSAAQAAGLSLNEYCTRRLAMPATGVSVHADAVRTVAAAADLHGSALVAVVLYGSWPAGQVATSSDVDVLIVVERGVELNRDLYRRWDARPLTWNGRPVDPHFVHVPGRDDAPSGVWAEAAVSGVLLFERDEAVSRHLVRVRAAIAEGRLVRRISHGQPYWTAAA
jgi:predicted nucleotidyltransferase